MQWMETFRTRHRVPADDMGFFGSLNKVQNIIMSLLIIITQTSSYCVKNNDF
jgi:hypothetical protein